MVLRYAFHSIQQFMNSWTGISSQPDRAHRQRRRGVSERLKYDARGRWAQRRRTGKCYAKANRHQFYQTLLADVMRVYSRLEPKLREPSNQAFPYLRPTSLGTNHEGFLSKFPPCQLLS